MIKKAESRTIADLLRDIDVGIGGVTKKADEPPSSAVDGEDPTKKKPQTPSGEIKSDLADNSQSNVSSAPANNDTQPTNSVGVATGHPSQMPLPEKVKDTKDDPGTESGLKAAAVDYSKLTLEDCMSRYRALGNEALAEVAVKKAKATTPQAESKPAVEPAVAAGYAAAQAAGDMQKRAEARELLRYTAEAALYAGNTVAEMLKRAEEEEKEEAAESELGKGGSPASEGVAPPMDPAAAGGPPAPPPAPAGPPAGGDPAAAGGMPGGAPGGMPGGDPAADKQEAIMLILSVMEEAGITPDELLATMSASMAPPAAGASPAEADAAVKMANTVRPLLPLVAEAANRYHSDPSTRRKVAQRKVLRDTLRELTGRK